MDHSLSDIIRDVRIVLEENADSTLLLPDETGVGMLQTDDIIENRLSDAVRNVLVSAPIEMINESKSFSTHAITWEGNHPYGKVDLPADFLRMVGFKMSDWERTVRIVTPYDSEEYVMQKSKYAGLRGNPSYPVVSVVYLSNNAETLEFYSCKDQQATISVAEYIPVPKVENGQIWLVDRLYSSIVYECAYQTAQVMGLEDASKFRTLSQEQFTTTK